MRLFTGRNQEVFGQRKHGVQCGSVIDASDNAHFPAGFRVPSNADINLIRSAGGTHECRSKSIAQYDSLHILESGDSSFVANTLTPTEGSALAFLGVVQRESRPSEDLLSAHRACVR